jgi:phage shock protein PspC (stress-responsive transcriptional regulator)
MTVDYGIGTKHATLMRYNLNATLISLIIVVLVLVVLIIGGI